MSDFLSKISKKDAVSLCVILLIIIFLGAYFLFVPSANTPFGPVELSGGSIEVSDQYELDRVSLTAELAEAGWITIHESISDAPAEIIGTSEYLEAGLFENLEIHLGTEMIAGFKYITLLHIDDGDQIFDAQLDFPVSVNGEVVRPDFVAQTLGEGEVDVEE